MGLLDEVIEDEVPHLSILLIFWTLEIVFGDCKDDIESITYQLCFSDFEPKRLVFQIAYKAHLIVFF